MSQRLEVMLTSRRPDGVWTWRAAGARHPKGVLEAELLPADAAVGDVLRVEAEVSVDGIAVRQVLPPKTDRPPPERVEHIGTQRFTEGVTGPDKFTGDGRERSERRRGGDRRRDGGRRSGGGDSGRPQRDGGRPQRDGGRPQRRGPEGRRRGDGPQRLPRLRPASTHRDAWLATLVPERKVLAERLANEGIRAVRQAVQQSGSPSASGDEAAQSENAAEEQIALVEELFSALRVADWRDRAEAARGVCDDVDLRDLRSVVAGAAQGAVDPEMHALAEELTRKLAARVDREHSAWIADMGALLGKGRVVTALRVSHRPPKAGTPLPESLATSLREAATGELHADSDDDHWVRMLEAAAQSPVRLVLTPRSLPAEPSERLLRAVRRFGDRLPALLAEFAPHLDSPATDERPAATESPIEVESSVGAEPAAAGESSEPPVEAESFVGAEPAAASEPSEPPVEAESSVGAEPAAAGEPSEPPVEAESSVEAEPWTEAEPSTEADHPVAAEPPAEVDSSADGEEPSADGAEDADVAQEVAQAAGEVEVV